MRPNKTAKLPNAITEIVDGKKTLAEDLNCKHGVVLPTFLNKESTRLAVVCPSHFVTSATIHSFRSNTLLLNKIK